MEARAAGETPEQVRGTNGDDAVARPDEATDPPADSGDESAEAAEHDESAPDVGDAASPAPPAVPGWASRLLRRLKALAVMFGLAIVAFATGLLVFNNMIMPHLVHSVGQVRVPDLANLTVEQAERSLQRIGLKLSRAGERFDPSVPRGFIISQDPPAETPVRGRKLVSVMVSLGEEFSSVPALFGESLRSARYLLERAGLPVGGITRAPSDEVGEGLIAGSDPPAESVLPRNTPVNLLVSSGAGAESYVMPDLLGREITGARRQLEALGFHVFTPPAAPSVGTIVFQDPPAGSRITRNVTILLQATGRIIR